MLVYCYKEVKSIKLHLVNVYTKIGIQRRTRQYYYRFSVTISKYAQKLMKHRDLKILDFYFEVQLEFSSQRSQICDKSNPGFRSLRYVCGYSITRRLNG